MFRSTHLRLPIAVVISLAVVFYLFSTMAPKTTMELVKYERLCSGSTQLDLTDTPPYINDIIMDMYADILRLVPRSMKKKETQSKEKKEKNKATMAPEWFSKTSKTRTRLEQDVAPAPFKVMDLGSGCGYKLHSLTTRYHAQGLSK